MTDSIAFILRRAANMLADTHEEIAEVSRDVVVDIMGGAVTGEVCVNHLVYDVMDDADDVGDADDADDADDQMLGIQLTAHNSVSRDGGPDGVP